MPTEQRELDFINFDEAKPKLLGWQSTFASYEVPVDLADRSRNLLSDVNQMLNLGEEEFSPVHFLELEHRVDQLMKEIHEGYLKHERTERTDKAA